MVYFPVTCLFTKARIYPKRSNLHTCDGKEDMQTKSNIILYLTRILPNAEHSCAGHEISLFFDMRSFFLMVVQVSRSLPALPTTEPWYRSRLTYDSSACVPALLFVCDHFTLALLSSVFICYLLCYLLSLTP